MKIAMILPRGMHFGPQAATSIDLCVRDAVRSSRFAGSTTIICEEIKNPFDGFKLEKYDPASKAQRIRKISKIIRSIGPDLIVVHQHLPTAAAVARRFPRIPVLLHKHNYIKATKRLRRFRRYRQMAKLSGIIFVSQSCRDRFRSDYPNCRVRQFVAWNGLPDHEWSPSTVRIDQILVVGRIHRVKGMVEAAEALACILPRHPGWSAQILGPPDDEDIAAQLKDIVRRTERLEWSGSLPHKEIVAEYCRSKISIVNSQEEPFGRTALEAFAGGAALLCSRVGGLEEVTGDACVPLTCGSSEEIAAKLDELIAMPERIKELAAAGRTRFERLFTIRRTTEVLDKIYCEITGIGDGTGHTD